MCSIVYPTTVKKKITPSRFVLAPAATMFLGISPWMMPSICPTMSLVLVGSSSASL